MQTGVGKFQSKQNPCSKAVVKELVVKTNIYISQGMVYRFPISKSKKQFQTARATLPNVGSHL